MKRKLLAGLLGVMVVEFAIGLAPVSLWTNVLSVTRTSSGTAVSNISLGNAIDNPTGNWLGTGLFTFGGGISVSSNSGFFGSRLLFSGTCTVPAQGLCSTGTNVEMSTGTTVRDVLDPNGNWINAYGSADTSGWPPVSNTSAFALTAPDYAKSYQMGQSSVLASGTLTTPATPISGGDFCVGSQLDITSFTLSANTGQSGVKDPPATLWGGVTDCWRYNIGNTQWYRISGLQNTYQEYTWAPGYATPAQITTAYAGYKTIAKPSTVVNINASTPALNCTTNPTVTVYECGTSSTCASPTTIGSGTVTTAGARTTITVSSAAINGGDAIAYGITGTCSALDIEVDVHAMTNN